MALTTLFVLLVNYVLDKGIASVFKVLDIFVKKKKVKYALQLFKQIKEQWLTMCATSVLI